MSQKLIHLTPHQFVVYRWHNGVVSEEAAFDPEGDPAALGDYLLQQRKTRFRVLTNLAEESFHADTIPFLSAKDRALIVARRLGQLFQSAPLSLTISLGYEKGRRKNERVLFASLNNGELLDPCLDAFRHCGTLIEGIHSTALLSKPLVDKTAASETLNFVLTMHGEMIRQSFFEGRELRFSRLSRVADSSIKGLAQAFHTEANRLYQYLLSQRILNRGKPVTVHIIAHDSVLASIEEVCQSSEVMRFTLHDGNTLARALGYKDHLANSNLDPLFLHLLATQPPKDQFASPALRQPFQLWQAGRALLAASALTIALALTVAGKFVLDARATNAQATSESRAAAEFSARYRTLAAAFPALPFSTARLRAITADYARLAAHNPGLMPALSQLSQGLGATPSVEVDSLDWSAPALTTLTAQSGQSQTTGGNAVRLVVNGHIRRLEGDSPRQVLARFDAFVNALRQHADADVEVARQPYDVGSEKSLSNTGPDALAEQDARPFSLTLTLKAPA